MKTVRVVQSLRKPPVPKTYSAQELKERDVPTGVYQAIDPDSNGYWVISDIAMFHFNAKEQRINTVGEPSTVCEPFIQIEDVVVQLNLISMITGPLP